MNSFIYYFRPCCTRILRQPIHWFNHRLQVCLPVDPHVCLSSTSRWRFVYSTDMCRGKRRWVNSQTTVAFYRSSTSFLSSNSVFSPFFGPVNHFFLLPALIARISICISNIDYPFQIPHFISRVRHSRSWDHIRPQDPWHGSQARGSFIRVPQKLSVRGWTSLHLGGFESSQDRGSASQEC